MYLKKIALLNFKNIEQEELTFCPGINCLVGDNGAGKTNIVDAVHYLSMCKSSLQMTDGQSIRHGADFFLVEGQYATDGGKSENVVCSFSRKGGKVLKRNGKEYDRLSDHVGLIPAVIVSPADGALISDAADERRRYLNAFISQLDRAYLSSVMRYNAVLAERNRLLKMQPDEVMLQIYDRQLVEHGEAIHARRREAAELLQPVVEAYYRTLSGDREQVGLHYRSELNERPFGEILLAARQKDLANEFTTAGIHRDDLVLRIGGYPLRKYGSQGQQKSFLIALKLAQYAIVARSKGERPLLLLDDLFDKLDAGRVEQLIRLVSGRDVRADPHHGLQPHPSENDTRQGRRGVSALHRRKRKGPAMRRTKTMLMGDLLEEFFKRPYVAAKVAEGKPARHVARNRRRPCRGRHHRVAARTAYSPRAHPIERAALRTLLPARPALRGDQPPLGPQAGPCGHHPVTRRPHEKSRERSETLPGSSSESARIT